MAATTKKSSKLSAFSNKKWLIGALVFVVIFAGAGAFYLQRRSSARTSSQYWRDLNRYAGCPLDYYATPPTVREGMRHNCVAVAQFMLNRFGTPVNVDGNFGPQTREAVRTFQYWMFLQKLKGFTEPSHVDGVVGPKTWGAMYSCLGDNYYSLTGGSDPQFICRLR